MRYSYAFRKACVFSDWQGSGQVVQRLARRSVYFVKLIGNKAIRKQAGLTMSKTYLTWN